MQSAHAQPLRNTNQDISGQSALCSIAHAHGAFICSVCKPHGHLEGFSTTCPRCVPTVRAPQQMWRGCGVAGAYSSAESAELPRSMTAQSCGSAREGACARSLLRVNLWIMRRLWAPWSMGTCAARYKFIV